MKKHYTPRHDPRLPRKTRSRVDIIEHGGWKMEVRIVVEFEGDLRNKEAHVLSIEQATGAPPTISQQDAKEYAIREGIARASNAFPVGGDAE